METSELALITTYPPEPLTLFNELLRRLPQDFVTINVATLDSEFGLLNRTVVYRGLTDGAVTFVTERNTRKYANLKHNPKLALTLYFPEVPTATGTIETWQVRLFDATAVELRPEQIAKLWQEESLYAKIRSHICECGAPVDTMQLKQKHDQLLQDFKNGHNKLAQTDTYTAFRVDAKRWDFYKTEPNKIADRVQYRRKPNNWDVFHVAA